MVRPAAFLFALFILYSHAQFQRLARGSCYSVPAAPREPTPPLPTLQRMPPTRGQSNNKRAAKEGRRVFHTHRSRGIEIPLAVPSAHASQSLSSRFKNYAAVLQRQNNQNINFHRALILFFPWGPGRGGNLGLPSARPGFMPVCTFAFGRIFGAAKAAGRSSRRARLAAHRGARPQPLFSLRRPLGVPEKQKIVKGRLARCGSMANLADEVSAASSAFSLSDLASSSCLGPAAASCSIHLTAQEMELFNLLLQCVKEENLQAGKNSYPYLISRSSCLPSPFFTFLPLSPPLFFFPPSYLALSSPFFRHFFPPPPRRSFLSPCRRNGRGGRWGQAAAEFFPRLTFPSLCVCHCVFCACPFLSSLLLLLLLSLPSPSTSRAVLRVNGGWVRDKLLGRDSSDIDIAVDCMTGLQLADKINELAARRIDTAGTKRCSQNQSRV
eukprot:GHVT01065040.1.p1 GENE.GHVT01065040.1~~GHVT01065040.1.p1  ORF type:complete len:480 (+),score=83.50 GHVT01065040.1:125-1441(+)